MRQCRTCLVEKDVSEFSGARHKCKSCSNLQNKEWRETNPEKEKARYLRNKPLRKEQAQRLYEANKVLRQEQIAQWSENNKGKRRAHKAQRRAAQLQRTPPWSEKEQILGTYKLATYLSKEYGKEIHVDHIVPLQGKKVSGLHCVDNLQLLYASDNLKKSNSFAI